MMGDPLGSSRMSSQKQNCEGMVGAQSGQYRAMVESSPGCGEGLDQYVTNYNCLCRKNFFKIKVQILSSINHVE